MMTAHMHSPGLSYLLPFFTGKHVAKMETSVYIPNHQKVRKILKPGPKTSIF